jgi:hypothetical protein
MVAFSQSGVHVCFLLVGWFVGWFCVFFRVFGFGFLVIVLEELGRWGVHNTSSRHVHTHVCGYTHTHTSITHTSITHTHTLHTHIHHTHTHTHTTPPIGALAGAGENITRPLRLLPPQRVVLGGDRHQVDGAPLCLCLCLCLFLFGLWFILVGFVLGLLGGWMDGGVVRLFG